MLTAERSVRAHDLACALSETCDLASDDEVVLEALGITFAGLLSKYPPELRGMIADQFYDALPGYGTSIEESAS